MGHYISTEAPYTADLKAAVNATIDDEIFYDRNLEVYSAPNAATTTEILVPGEHRYRDMTPKQPARGWFPAREAWAARLYSETDTTSKTVKFRTPYNTDPSKRDSTPSYMFPLVEITVAERWRAQNPDLVAAGWRVTGVTLDTTKQGKNCTPGATGKVTVVFDKNTSPKHMKYVVTSTGHCGKELASFTSLTEAKKFAAAETNSAAQDSADECAITKQEVYEDGKPALTARRVFDGQLHWNIQLTKPKPNAKPTGWAYSVDFHS